MLIVCPTCSSEYTIETDRIGPSGRVVRCATCRAIWFVPPVEAARTADEDGAIDAPVQPRERAGFGRGSAASSRSAGRLPLALTITLAVAFGGAVTMRKTVVRHVPQSAAAFAALGLPVNLVGLQIGGVTSELAEDETGHVLHITGEISNQGSDAVAVPPLALAIEGETGGLLYNWSDRADRGEIGPHETKHFQAKLSSPPPDGRRVVVSFSTEAATRAVASR